MAKRRKAIRAGRLVKVALYSCPHPKDGEQARAAKSKCDPALLEPVFKVEIVIPDEYLGDVMGDVTSRRGRVDGMEARGNAQVVRAFVPLSEMFGYATALRSNTQGRGVYTMIFDHYEEVPKNIAEDIIKKSGN